MLNTAKQVLLEHRNLTLVEDPYDSTVQIVMPPFFGRAGISKFGLTVGKIFSDPYPYFDVTFSFSYQEIKNRGA